MPRRVATACLTLLVVMACDAPRFTGPMIQALPDGLVSEPTAQQNHELFPQREVVERNAFVEFGALDFNGIYIRKHNGGTTQRDVEEARVAAAQAEADQGVAYGDVEVLVVDGQPAWAWIEETRDARGLQFVEYRMAVSYGDSMTYTVEFKSGDPWWKVRQDSMRAVVQSWEIGKTEWDFGLIGLIGVIAVLLGSVMWNKVRVKNPSTNYSLPTIPKPDEDGEADPGTTESGAPPEAPDQDPKP